MLEAAEDAGAETEAFSLGDLSVQPCTGCMEVCHSVGTCPKEDDFEKIENAMIEADGIIFASPNYFVNVSAQMKALIDRFCLTFTLQKLSGKYGAAVVTSGGSDPQAVVDYLLHIITQFGFWKLGSIGAVEAQFEDAGEKARLMESATALGKRMVDAIRNKETFADQEDDRYQAFEIYKYLATTQKEQWPFAYDYWKTHWGLKE
jgi:multimeric flavodoxin WrbA